MKTKSLFIILQIFILSSQIYAQDEIKANKTSPLIIGEKHEIYSTILNENRALNIYLPNGYSNDSAKVYPVIYLLDGSMDEDFIHISGLVQFGSFSWIDMIPESIVVGIANVDRKRDFTYPSQNKEDIKQFPTTGKSETFINAMESEIIPFIEKTYKVGPARTIIGQSLGGLLSTEILFKKPELFTNFIIISPSLWWDDKSLLNYEPQKYNSKKSIYIGVGKEGYGMEEMAKELYDKLMLGKDELSNIYFDYFEAQDHGDVLHLAVYNAFEKIFEKEEK